MEGQRLIVERIYRKVLAIPQIAPLMVVLPFLAGIQGFRLGITYRGHIHPEGVAISAATF